MQIGMVGLGADALKAAAAQGAETAATLESGGQGLETGTPTP